MTLPDATPEPRRRTASRSLALAAGLPRGFVKRLLNRQHVRPAGALTTTEAVTRLSITAYQFGLYRRSLGIEPVRMDDTARASRPRYYRVKDVERVRGAMKEIREGRAGKKPGGETKC